MEFSKLPEMILPYGLKIIHALLIWFIGRFLIKFALKLFRRAIATKKLETTLVGYIESILRGVLTVFLVIAILDIFGVQTTSLAALVAAAGVAIGAAWAGLLSNFAAGFFLILLKPYKVGDTISAAGVLGEVVEIGLFVTSINTGENAKVFVGNAKVFGDVITNFSANRFRRVDLKCQLAHDQDPLVAISKLKSKILQISNVLKNPEIIIEINEFNHYGPLLIVRPFCLNENYSQVYFDTNKIISEVVRLEKFSIPALYSKSF